MDKPDLRSHYNQSTGLIIPSDFRDYARHPRHARLRIPFGALYGKIEERVPYAGTRSSIWRAKRDSNPRPFA